MMHQTVLTSIHYTEHPGTSKEWELEELSLKKINLIVGKNATGKSRTLSVIIGLSKILTTTPRFNVSEGIYDCKFTCSIGQINYKLEIKNQIVVNEQYFLNDDEVLTRHSNGEGRIEIHLDNKETQKVAFKQQPSDPAVLGKRDPILHPFLEPIHEWVESTRFYTFGSNLGKSMVSLGSVNSQELNDKDQNQVVAIFRAGLDNYKKEYTDAIVRDMRKMGYYLDEIQIIPSERIKASINQSTPEGLSLIGIKEDGSDRYLEQMELSDGMFRALSILIQITYSEMTGRANCIIIDDIGEGLDFERATTLIEILREKAKKSNYQLILASNDSFVMNEVPLEEWIVLKRTGGHVKSFDKNNSADIFNNFRFTGLTNFSFFEMDFLNTVDAQEGSE